MPVTTVIIILLVVLLIAVMPTWNYSRTWGTGYFPSAILGVILIVLLIMALTGRL